MADTKMTAQHYTYSVMYSAEDGEYVAICNAFPLMSWLEPTAGEAIEGMIKLVTDTLDDMYKEGENIPEASMGNRCNICGMPVIEHSASNVKEIHQEYDNLNKNLR